MGTRSFPLDVPVEIVESKSMTLAPPLRTLLERSGIARVARVVIETDAVPRVWDIRSTFERVARKTVAVEDAWASLDDGSPCLVSIGSPYDYSRWAFLELAASDAPRWLRDLLASLDEWDGTALSFTTEGDRQLRLSRSASGWSAEIAQGAIARHAEERAALVAVWRRSNERAAAEIFARLPRSVRVEPVDEQPSPRPTMLADEAYGGGWSGVWTRRIELHRSRRVRDEWLDAALRTLGDPASLYFFPDEGSVAAGDGRWRRLDVLSRTSTWLGDLIEPTAPAYLVLMSLDGARAVVLTHVTGVDFLHATELAVSDFFDLQESRARLDELLATVAPIDRTSLSWIGTRVSLAAMTSGAPTSTLPASSSDGRVAAWIRDAVARVRTDGDRLHVSLGARAAVPWFAIRDDADATGLAALWTRGALDRLFLMDDDAKTTVALLRTPAHLEAYVRPT